jgi:hypothetical protein
MRQIVLSFVVLVALSFGCGQTQSPPAGPSQPPTQSGPSAEDVAALVKATQDAASKGGGAASGTFGTATATVQVGDHKLSVHADAPVNVVGSSNHLVADIQGRHLDVDFENGRVMLNEAEYAKLPAGTKDVEIELRSGNLTVKAEGKEVPKSDKSSAP